VPQFKNCKITEHTVVWITALEYKQATELHH
jgi:hypothetical protein